MCGITGIYAKDLQAIPEKLRAATRTLVHRGPEKEGYYFSSAGTLGLGHRRLCIIDLSEEASQPLTYQDRYTIVYNGELYNYIELKEQLEKKGFAFHTKSDTEVVVAAYAAFGTQCLQHFDGMFSFAIWDEKEQQLFAARDRLGEKPFFYYYDEEQFAFASEQKALWAMGISKKVNEALLYNFLTIGYVSNPSDPQETFYEHIDKLPAASFLLLSLPQNQLRIETYWQPAIDTSQPVKESEAIERFIYLLSDSIRKKMRSDVAIGTSLSGGLDSSAIVAFCNTVQTNTYTHKCFTAVFDDFEKNERAYATQVAKEFHLDHHFVSIASEEVAILMDGVMHCQEEPFSSASPLVQYKVFQTARQNGVTVLLDGQGADEILAGYHKYYKWYWQELYRQNLLGPELKAAKELGVQELFGLKARTAARFPQFAAAIREGRKAKEAYKSRDLNRDFAFQHKQQFYYTLPPTADLNGALFYNTFLNGLDELLRLADRNSMAHSVEVRLPFLNHDLVAFLFTLPASFKIRQGWTKWLLRKAVEKQLPPEIVWRKEKVGFEPPQKLWMQNKSVQEAIQTAREKLVSVDVLDKSVLTKPIKAKEAHAADSLDWRYWSAAYLFEQ
jgi:asparagine synthase (glutamine-hydrolysing)